MFTSQILSIYKENGSEIFPSASSGSRGFLDRMFKAKYDSEGLRRCLKDIFGNRRFADLKENIAITSFDTAQAEPVIFRSNYGNPGEGYGDLEVVEVALATSAAPTYFVVAEAGDTYMIDGGIWANCPAMVGLIESIRHFGINQNDVRVLSIGTTTEPKSVGESQKSGGIISWARPAASTIMHAASVSAIENTGHLAGYFLRIDTTVESGKFQLDGVDAIGELEALGRIAARTALAECKTKFFSTNAAYRPAVPAN